MNRKKHTTFHTIIKWIVRKVHYVPQKHVVLLIHMGVFWVGYHYLSQGGNNWCIDAIYWLESFVDIQTGGYR